MIRTVSLLLLAAAASCSAPDRPTALIDAPPAPLMEWLQPDTLRSDRLGPGVVYRYLWSARGPWAIHLVEADLGRCSLGLEVVAAPSDPEIPGGRATVTELVEGHVRQSVAAVNGDFFTPEGFPLGPEISGGVVRTRRRRPALAFSGRAAPFIGVSGIDGREGGERIEANQWAVEPAELGGVQMIGGFPELLDAGTQVGDLGVADNPSFAASRHPRTAVGYDSTTDKLWLAVIDGRQGEYSTGMSLPELVHLFQALGAGEALNLDGGGSSVMVLSGRTVSRPSDAAGQRPVVNALLLVDEAGLCEIRPRD